MKVTCVSIYDARDPHAFGGRCYHSLLAIQELADEMQFVFPVIDWKIKTILTAKQKYHGKIGHKTYFPFRDSILIRHCSKQITRELAAIESDVILSPMSPGSQPVAFVECRQPIVIWTDATFAGALDLYYKHEIVCAESIRDGFRNERAALHRAELLIYWTQWAAESAIRAYDVDPNKIAVVPPGAWLENRPDFEEAIQLVAARPTDRCRLLFIGLGWWRKGGDIALDIAARLNAGGLKTELTVVGCQREELPEPLPNFVRVVGYIDRTSKEGSEQFEALLRDSHFLILPSRFDASPLVCMEACAFALPSLATCVGGVPDIVRNDINGRTFALNADIEEYCRFVQAIFGNTARYKELALSTLNEYEKRLNTRTAAHNVLNLMRERLL
jgi:glycosyltransferase involved in cell wall biosynthesis